MISTIAQYSLHTSAYFYFPQNTHVNSVRVKCILLQCTNVVQIVFPLCHILLSSVLVLNEILGKC